MTHTNTNPDFTNIQWDPNYTDVMYLEMINEKEQKIWVLMRIFFETFPKEESRPKIKEINPKPIKENVIALLQHYNVDVKRNIFTEQIEVYKNKNYQGTLQLNKIFFIDIATHHEFKIPKTHFFACIASIAWDNSYNSVADNWTCAKTCEISWKSWLLKIS